MITWYRIVCFVWGERRSSTLSPFSFLIDIQKTKQLKSANLCGLIGLSFRLFAVEKVHIIKFSSQTSTSPSPKMPPSDKKRKAEAALLEQETAAALANPPALPPAPTSSTSPALPASQAAAPSSSKARPKRARKSEKKEETENTSRFHCDFCGRDLSSAIRARCAVCPDYDSCLDCFSVGAALKPHQPEHSYRLIEVVHTPIFQIGWSADEEDKLLEGLELYGVGNWEQVAKLVGSKNPFETEQHFMKVFLQSSNAPLPDPTRMVPPEKSSFPDKNDEVDPKLLRVMHMHQQEDAAGWMEKRQDFVYEWDNEAEELIGDMEVTDDDTKSEKDLKANVLKIYADKLNERARRKEFVLDRGLTSFKAYQAVEKKRPKDERDLRDKLKVFMRFISHADMEKFIIGILEERQLRSKIELYQDGRAVGARTIEECNRLTANAKTKGKAAATAADITPPIGASSAQRRQRRSNGEGSAADSVGSSAHNGNGVAVSSTGSDSKEKKAANFNDMDPQLMPGAELLSRTELSLCATLKISPHQYMIIKDVMVRESARNGCLRKKDAKAIVRLDSTKVFKIYDYLLACGWIKSCNSAANASRNATSNVVAPNGTKV